MFKIFKRKVPSGSAGAYVPEEGQKRKLRRFYFYAIYLFFGCSLVIIGVLWFLLETPLFRVQSIEVSGNREVLMGDVLGAFIPSVIRGSIFGAFFGFDHLFAIPEKLGPEDLISLPKVKSANIEKSYEKRTVLIKIDEREPYGIWCLVNRPNDQACWWFDGEGVIFKRAVSAQGSLLTAVSDYSRQDLRLYSKILPGEFIANAFSVFEALGRSGLRIKEERLNDLKLEELEVLTFNGPRVYFSMRFPAVNTPEIIRKLSEKSGFKDLEYVDFRVENRAYYK